MIGRLTTLLWRELESLFFAPLAYIVLTVFLILNGFSFAIALQQSGGVVEDTVRIFLGDASNFGPEYRSAYAVAVVLFVMTLILTLMGARVLKRYREVYE